MTTSPHWPCFCTAGLLHTSILIILNRSPHQVTQSLSGLELVPGLCLVPRNWTSLLYSYPFTLWWRLASVHSTPAYHPPHPIACFQPWYLTTDWAWRVWPSQKPLRQQWPKQDWAYHAQECLLPAGNTSEMVFADGPAPRSCGHSITRSPRTPPIQPLAVSSRSPFTNC